MHIHILGICGTFMGGLAALAREAGHTVTGCDAAVYPPMSDQLRALGIELIEDFGEEQLALQPDIFVIGNVVSRAKLPNGKPKFALMEAILDQGLPYTSGPQWLSEHVLAGRHVLAVAGTHGKTTTTAMLSWILEACGLNPGFLIGGVPLNFGISARLGERNPSGTNKPLFVIEADEYDTAFFDKRSKFVHYKPGTAILNNLEFDHADIFDNLAAIERQFAHLLRTIASSGQVVVEANNPALQRVLAQGVYCGQTSFGTDPAEWQAHGPAHDFDVLYQNKTVGHLTWAISGLHNQRNALASIASAAHVGVAPHDACVALATFQNVRRRMELRGTIKTGQGDIELIDDFAHHPTAIRTTVGGLRGLLDAQGHNTARIVAVFEPRSNTMKLGAMKAQLPDSLTQADLVFCYTAGLDWDAAAALLPMGERATCTDSIDELVRRVTRAARAGDRIVCMSNGGFSGVHDKLLGALQAKFT